MIVVQCWMEGELWFAKICHPSWPSEWACSACFTKRALLRSVHRFLNTMNPIEEVAIVDIND